MPDQKNQNNSESSSGGIVRRVLNANPDLLLRALSAVILAPIALVLTWAGGFWFAGLALLGMLIVYWEWHRIILQNTLRPIALLGYVLLLFIGYAYYLAEPIWIAAGLVVGALVLYGAGGFDRSARWLSHGYLYAGLSLVALLSLRQGDEGLFFIIYLFLVVWGTDIGAYVCGRSFGGPKLWPAVSPNKTWSGALGGIAFSSLLGMGFVAFAGGTQLLWAFALAVVLSAVSQLGDLFESSLKRRFKVKDSSRLIPGHGGLLDRVDGLVAAAVFSYVIGVMLGGQLFDPNAGLMLFAS
ncbi:Phosphatidate cytidylyltransferase [Pseudovibrio axinellae]|uniref:Phosphatidate cytidylyltransferase n=1 Tax=Pseudovibrio axinellae TaxID=989403 RepID=A0A166B4L9_9HYPH|nr:phosphatidate cytidylyltransferase [Pseudovibrio axinellae]KZL21882.1 Phosphatidate cytidylyltransferase [Pseudovibrio axinellae]SEQ82192.1 phosphatidate cytidylyltransferase [Pseudovibrio axinellae]